MEMNERLLQSRKDAKLTQEQLAKLASISKTHYQYIEYGKVDPSVSVALKLANALHKTVEELFGA